MSNKEVIKQYQINSLTQEIKELGDILRIKIDKLKEIKKKYDIL